MKKNFFILCAIATLIATVSCIKDELPSASNTLYMEDVTYAGSDSKAYIDNRYLCWENGDQVRLQKIGGNAYDGNVEISYPNGNPSVIVSAGDGFTHTEGESDVYGAYPKALFEGLTLGSTTTFTYPSAYEYVVTNGRQKISCPMIAKVTNRDNKDYLSFVSLCTILKVVVPKPTNGAFVANSITVTSSNGSNLSGDATVNFGTQVVNTNNLDINSISMSFPNGNVAINETQTFYIPIPPVAANTILTIKVNNALNNTKATKKISANQPIPANVQATINFSEDAVDAAAYSRYQFYDYITNYNNGLISQCLPIDLGIQPDNNSIMEMTFIPIVATGSQYYSGSNVPSEYTVFSIGGSQSNNYFNTYFNGSSRTSEGSSASTSITRISSHKYRIKVEMEQTSLGSNVFYMKSTFEDLTASKLLTASSTTLDGGIIAANFILGIPNIHVFGYNEERVNPGMRLYSYKIWRSGGLYRNFVPAIDTKGTENTADDEVGVYDMKSASFIATPNYVVGND